MRIAVRLFRIIRPVATVFVVAAFASGQEAADFFRENCTSCHTIGGGRLTGPDLKNVSGRQDRQWLVQFMINPQAVLDRSDPYAMKLQQEARGVVMPTINRLDRARAEALLNLIEAESKLEKSQFVGLQLSDRPFTAQDIALGRDLFFGVRRFSRAAPACLSCHTVKDAGALGGGRLGPDLTRVFERLEGRRNLAAWLVAPATPTMQPVFRKHALTPEEILPMVAFLEGASKTGGQDDSPSVLTFFLVGLGGAVAGLLVFDSAWKQRLRAVRRPLVDAANGIKERKS